MRVIICGDRNATERWERVVAEYVKALDKNKDVVIEGGADGIDAMASRSTEMQWVTCITVRANWEAYGKQAGPMRNQRMLDDFNPDKVIAFHGMLQKSKGTLDMLRRGLKAGKECHVCINPEDGFIFLLNEDALENLCNILCSQETK
jgi:hypothetical protein